MASDPIITPDFRLAFPHVFEPDTSENGGNKYTITMLFPEGTDLTALRKLAADAVKARWPDEKTRPKGIRSPFRDGNEVTWDGFAGNIFIRASSQYQPGVVDAKVQRVIDPSKVFGGCWARAQVHAYAYDQKGNQGVSFGLNNLQLVPAGDRPDEPFGGNRAEDAFDAVAMPAGGDSESGEDMFD